MGEEGRSELDYGVPSVFLLLFPVDPMSCFDSKINEQTGEEEGEGERGRGGRGEMILFHCLTLTPKTEFMTVRLATWS